MSGYSGIQAIAPRAALQREAGERAPAARADRKRAPDAVRRRLRRDGGRFAEGDAAYREPGEALAGVLLDISV